MRAQIHFIANGIFKAAIAGGDLHLMRLAGATAGAGHELNFFGGHALCELLSQHGIHGTVTLTDDAPMPA